MKIKRWPLKAEAMQAIEKGFFAIFCTFCTLSKKF
jgi:hypothetical protein